jgi:hypothetical protein
VFSDAEAKIKPLPSSPEKARSLLQIADVLAPLDADRAFDVLNLAVATLNKSDAEAAIETTGGANFVFNLKDYGMPLVIAERNLTPVVERLISALTKVDSTRAFTAATSVEKPSLRIIAQIAYARSELEQAKEKKAKLAQKKSAN